MRINHIMYMAGLLSLMTACSSEDAQQPQGGRVPVSLSYTTEPGVDMRVAAATNLNTDYIESGKSVTVEISVANANNYSEYTYTTGESGALALPDSAPYYPLDGKNVDILAYYPSFTGEEFTIETDQTTDANYAKSDLMWATPVKNQVKTTSNVPLNFTHKMAKIIVNATAGTAISQINSVTLKQVQPTVTFNKGDGNVSGLTGTAGNVEMVKGETAATASGAAVIPEQTIDGALLEIGVTKTDGTPGTATYTVSNKTFSANHVYTLNISVNWPEVGAETAITGWTEGGTAFVSPTKVLTFNVNGVIFNMIAVKAGSFTNFASTGNSPATGVTVNITKDYYIGQTEVTNGLYKAVIGSTPSQKNTGDNYPVEYVSWETINTASTGFLAKLNAALATQLAAYGISDAKFTLPTEAQWEFAARGGNESKGYTYSGSATIGDVAWYTENSSSTTHPVATKGANELGLYDMSGNVWEWCSDWYGSLTNNTTLTDPTGAASGSNRVFRGGGWHNAAEFCAVTYRGNGTPAYVSSNLGFRLALQLNP